MCIRDRYTIGQRKGLGISAETRLFVSGKNMAENTVTVDYIHGAAAARAMAADPAKPATALLMPDFAKADLFKGVVLGLSLIHI